MLKTGDKIKFTMDGLQPIKNDWVEVIQDETHGGDVTLKLADGHEWLVNTKESDFVIIWHDKQPDLAPESLVDDLKRLRERFGYQRGLNASLSQEKDINNFQRLGAEIQSYAWEEAIELLDDVIENWNEAETA